MCRLLLAFLVLAFGACMPEGGPVDEVGAGAVGQHTLWNGLWRPLRGGVAISNERNHEGVLGTLGLVATSDGTDRYLVSAAHVLGREKPTDPPAAADEPISQPWGAESVVASLDASRLDTALDVAAARVLDGVATVAEIHGLGALTPPRPPVVGTRVMKAGMRTGVTEGVIASVEGDRVVIVPPVGFPPEYEVSVGGDSGSLWVTRDERSPVALHLAGETVGPEEAYAVPIVRALEVLRLSAVVE